MVGVYPLNNLAVCGENRLQPRLVLLVVKFYYYPPNRVLFEASSHSFQDKKFGSFNINLDQVNIAPIQVVESFLHDLDRWSVLHNSIVGWVPRGLVVYQGKKTIGTVLIVESGKTEFLLLAIQKARPTCVR